MRRMLAYWANPDRADTEVIGDDLVFAGTSRAVYEAFGLPWIGGDSAESIAPIATPTAVAQPILDVTQRDPADATEATPTASAPAGAQALRPVVSAPKPRRLMPNKSELEQLREEIRDWIATSKLGQGNKWNDILYAMVKEIDPRAIGVPAPLFAKLVTSDKVKLQGTTTRPLDYFVLPAEPWVRNGLEAFISLRQDTGNTLEDVEFHRRNLAAMMRLLQKSLAAFCDRKIPRLADGARWSPAAAFTQILLARAYLRGSTSPEASFPDQLTVVLSDEGISDADFSARSVPWQDWLNATKGFHDKLRAELRAMVSLPLGDKQEDNSNATAGGALLVDASEMAGAILRFGESAKVDPFPEDGGALPDLYRKARDLVQHWSDKRVQIDRVEFDQVKGRSESLSAMLREKDVATHLERLDRCISGIAEQLPGAATDKVQAWKQGLIKLGPRLNEDAGRRVENLIFAFEEDEVPAKLTLRLAWLARQPVRDLEDVRSAVHAGERAVEELRNHARDCVNEAGGTGSLNDVKQVGRALQAIVAAPRSQERAA